MFKGDLIDVQSKNILVNTGKRAIVQNFSKLNDNLRELNWLTKSRSAEGGYL